MRALSAPNAAQAAAESATVVHFIQLNFSGGTLRLCTAPVSLTWDGQTWQGTGFALQWGPVEESADDRSQGAQLKLSGVDQSIIAILLGEYSRGREVTMWRGWLSATGQLTDAPYQIFSGFMNEAWTIDETVSERGDANTCEITTRITSRLALFDQHRGIQCNLMSHQRYYPDDMVFQFVPSLMDVKIEWPHKNYFKK